ncbi:OmpW/AlkL family protein [Halomonas saccharevitans]|uniref:Outer membrane protein n=1 Tax=Halomonas saccharevitans TaxID=416872 RepID=A0A1I7ALI9_9GAMM|nr:OmpW family outer membrane protein [Halomonas saccharevitans]SFT75715.1 outer membrane protein [Halomonas saccharevitans]
MNSRHLIAMASLATTALATAPIAVAYQVDDTVMRGGIAKAEVTDDSGSLDILGELKAFDPRSMSSGARYLFSNRPGIELNGIAAFGKAAGSVDRLPLNLMIHVYPMGDSGSLTQPYVGSGLDYTHISEEELEGLDVDEPYGPAGQDVLDMAVTSYPLIGAFARYAITDAEVGASGAAPGEADIDPMIIGDGATFRF